MLAEMKQLVKEKNICVLATIAGSKPYCSLMPTPRMKTAPRSTWRPTVRRKNSGTWPKTRP